jgi:hypothetical protein
MDASPLVLTMTILRVFLIRHLPSRMCVSVNTGVIELLVCEDGILLMRSIIAQLYCVSCHRVADVLRFLICNN